MKFTKYYFLPFLDYLISLGICIVFTMFFGSWFGAKIFGFLMGVILTFVMCGCVYSRMWKLSRNNMRYKYGLDKTSGMKFVLPLVIVSFFVALLFFLGEKNIIPMDGIVKTYYEFPDNLPRQAVHIDYFSYMTVFARFWFSYLLGFSGDMPAFLMFFASILIFVSGTVGFSLGAKDKSVLTEYTKVSAKVKKKFNE